VAISPHVAVVGLFLFRPFLGVAPMLISLRDCQQTGRDPI